MALPENRNPFVRKLSAVDCIDALMRFVAMLLGLSFLLAFLRIANSSSDLDMEILIVSQAVLMFVCVAYPARHSRRMLFVLLIVAVVAVVDFIARALPGLQPDYYLVDIVIYVTELIIVIWFTAMGFRRKL